jgi:hypothetical protein
LENITSDRKLVELASLHVGIRAFLGYEFTHPLPSHSTVSRTRQRLSATIFEACFTHVVGLCVQQGLVSGHTQVIDSAYIKANAAMSRLQPKRSLGAVEAPTPRGPATAPPVTASTGRLAHLQRFQTFGLRLSSVVADAGYCSGENYEQLEVRGLTGYIPAHGMYKAERTGFTYDAASDSYTCSQGNQLTFHKVFVDPKDTPRSVTWPRPLTASAAPFGNSVRVRRPRKSAYTTRPTKHTTTACWRA